MHKSSHFPTSPSPSPIPTHIMTHQAEREFLLQRGYQRRGDCFCPYLYFYTYVQCIKKNVESTLLFCKYKYKVEIFNIWWIRNIGVFFHLKEKQLSSDLIFHTLSSITFICFTKSTTGTVEAVQYNPRSNSMQHIQEIDTLMFLQTFTSVETCMIFIIVTQHG